MSWLIAVMPQREQVTLIMQPSLLSQSGPSHLCSQGPPEEQAQSGVSEGYVRLSIGLEHIDDILADLSQALDKAKS